MKLLKYLCGTTTLLAFLALLGSAGACDAGTISLGQSMIQSVISLAVIILSALAGMYFDYKEKEKNR